MCGLFKPKEFDFAPRFFISGLDLHLNTNVDISCLNWNNLGIINVIKIVEAEAKSNSMGLKPLQTKFQLPPHKDESKHSFLSTPSSVKKWLSLVPDIFRTLTATATKH